VLDDRTGGTGPVDADQDVATVAGRDLRQCRVQHGHMVSRGERAGRPDPLHDRQVFPGVGAPRGQGESARDAVTTLPPSRFPGPLAEPAVRLSTQRALHGCCRSRVQAQGTGIAAPRYR
jgi:hypothetical protein